MVDLPDPDDVAARARAALAFAKIDVKSADDRIGISAATMARIVSPTNPRGARSIEELWSIADACGVPRRFMELGFDGNHEPELAERVEALESRLVAVESRLAEVLRRVR